MKGPMNCLWIGRDIPDPESTGDRIYSKRLSMALANRDLLVSFLGLVPPGARLRTLTTPEFSWIAVEGERKSYFLAAVSLLPLAAATLRTTPMMQQLVGELGRDWDVIVLDNYATAWALKPVLEYRRRHSNKTLLVHVSHNHETALAESLYANFRGSTARKIFLRLNHIKIRRIERKLLKEADLVTTITAEDGRDFAPVLSDRTKQIVLTPGYTGNRLLTKSVKNTDRRVVLVGSFRWVVKQQNLTELLKAADAAFALNNIKLDIIGDTPSEIIAEYAGTLRATTFHGFVDDCSQLFEAARVAIVPETVGGGFKLKILDYIFNRLPIAALGQASAGLPESIRKHLLLAESMEELISVIIDSIDRIEILDSMQAEAFDAAASLFEWSDRGDLMRAAIRSSMAPIK